MAGKRAAEWMGVESFDGKHTVRCRVVDASVDDGIVCASEGAHEVEDGALWYALVARPDTGELVMVSTLAATLIDPNDPNEQRHEREWPRLARLQAGAAR